MRPFPYSVSSLVLGAIGLLPVQLLALPPHMRPYVLEEVIGTAPELAPVEADTPVAPGDTVDTLAARLATITTDTGDFAPGHKDFSRYNTPGLCRAVATVVKDRFRHSLEVQLQRMTLTEEHQPGDTVGTGTAAVIARACGGRFALGQTPHPVRDLEDLFYLALFEQNDSLVQQAFAAWMTAHPQKRDAYVNGWVTEVFGNLHFDRPALAATLLHQAETHDSLQWDTREGVRNYLKGAFMRDGDTAAAYRTLEQQYELARHAPDRRAGLPVVEGVFMWRMRQAAPLHTDSLSVIARQAQAVLRGYGKTEQVNSRFRPLGYVNWGGLPLDSVVTLLAPKWYTMFRQNQGRMRAPKLEADYWFPAPSQASGPAARGTPAGASGKPVIPVPGKVNVICLGGLPINGWQHTMQHGLSSGWGEQHIIKRWLAEYGDAGLVVTVVRRAAGEPWYNFGGNASDFGGASDSWLFRTPAVDAQLWHWYDQVYHQLPVTVAVQVQPTTQWLPPPDGRRLAVAQIQYQDYVDALLDQDGSEVSADPGSCTVIGRDGSLLLSDASSDWADWDVNQLLLWLFRGPGGGIVAQQSGAVRPPRAVVPTAQPGFSGGPILPNSLPNTDFQGHTQ